MACKYIYNPIAACKYICNFFCKYTYNFYPTCKYTCNFSVSIFATLESKIVNILASINIRYPLYIRPTSSINFTNESVQKQFY